MAVFTLSALLHVGLLFATHHYKKLRDFQRFSHKLDEQKVHVKPIKVVEDQHLDRVRNVEFFNGVIKAYYYPNFKRRKQKKKVHLHMQNSIDKCTDFSEDLTCKKGSIINTTKKNRAGERNIKSASVIF